MVDPIESDVIYGPLDESEEAVAAANELAEKNDDPDMQVIRVHLNFFIINIKKKQIFRCQKMFMYN
jgi:hypothetical protein